MDRLSWNQYFMNLVYLVAMRSPDERTRVGAIIISSKDFSIISTGYNGFPMGIIDQPARQERPEKYYWFEHAERNAIYLAARNGHSLDGCTMFTTGTPCTDCARAIIQSGIVKVVVDKAWKEFVTSEIWKEHAKRSEDMFFEGGVELEEIEVGLVKIHRFLDGKQYD